MFSKELELTLKSDNSANGDGAKLVKGPIRFKFAGFGGQGLMLFGELVAGAGMRAGNHVTWLPSYGPEMRGGTANCHVVVSNAEIGSPVVDSAISSSQ